jgi:hypothetical protein
LQSFKPGRSTACATLDTLALPDNMPPIASAAPPVLLAGYWQAGRRHDLGLLSPCSNFERYMRSFTKTLIILALVRRLASVQTWGRAGSQLPEIDYGHNTCDAYGMISRSLAAATLLINGALSSSMTRQS